MSQPWLKLYWHLGFTRGKRLMFKMYQTQKQKEKYYKNHDKLQNKRKVLKF